MGMTCKLFQSPEGGTSMRRFIAFLFGCSGVSAGIVSIFLKCDWQTVAVSFGIPGIVSVMCLVCTTVSDVTNVIESIKGLKQ